MLQFILRPLLPVGSEINGVNVSRGNLCPIQEETQGISRGGARQCVAPGWLLALRFVPRGMCSPPELGCSMQGAILARGVCFVEQPTLSTAPFRQLDSSELFIASQISSPICLSAYENASLCCTCYISLLLSKIKSQNTLPTSLFICIRF